MLTHTDKPCGGGQPLQGSPRSRRVASSARLASGASRSSARPASPRAGDPLIQQPAAAPLARYVVQAVPSREDAAARFVASLAGDAVRACFPLRRQMPRQKAGEWGYATDLLLPGYLLLDADDPEAVARLLARSTQAADVLAAGGRVAALSDAEAALLAALGGADHVVRTSRGRIEDGRLMVESGPLAGREGLVCHVDRHRRAAWLDPSRADEVLLGRSPSSASPSVLPAGARGLKVGLEVVSKS